MEKKGMWFHRLFGGNSHAAQPSQHTDAAPSLARTAFLMASPGTTVLIVDDSKTIHGILGKKLQRQGYETLSAYDGRSGIELAIEHQPALILMDVVMPGISGFHATRSIRKHPNARVAATPVIIMSGNQEATDQFWSLKIGANDFLVKPFDDQTLFNCIEKTLYPNSREIRQVQIN